MKQLLSFLLLSLALTGGFTACTSPDIMVAGLKVELTQVVRTPDGAVHVTWRMSNPNVVSYVLSKTSNRITLDGTVIGTVDELSALGVPAQNQIEHTGVLIPANTFSGATLDQALAQGSAAYRVDASIALLIVDDKFEKIHLTGSGRVAVTAK